MEHFPKCVPSRYRKCKCEIKRFSLIFLITLVIFLVEFFGSEFSNSLALLSDAFHVFIDLWAVGLALITECLVGVKSRKVRTIRAYSGFASSMLLAAVIVYIVWRTIARLHQSPEIFTSALIMIALIGLAGNVIAAMLLRFGEKSLTHRALLRHVLGDTLQSVGVVIVGLLIACTGITVFDSFFSLIVAAGLSIWLFRNMKESLQELKIK